MIIDAINEMIEQKEYDIKIEHIRLKPNIEHIDRMVCMTKISALRLFIVDLQYLKELHLNK